MTIHTVYNPGDKVYYMSSNEIHATKIVGLAKITFYGSSPTQVDDIIYKCENGKELEESLLFDTKLALISSLTGMDL